MAIRFPSLQRAYDDFYSRDPAIIPRPAEPADTATIEEIAAYRAAFEEWSNKIKVARETGRWDLVIVPGGVPTKFVMGQVDRNAWRTIVDRMQLAETNKMHIGMTQLASLLFRLAIQDIPGLDIKVTRYVDPEWGWEMAQPELVTLLDSADPKIVGELSSGIWRRLQEIPKN